MVHQGSAAAHDLRGMTLKEKMNTGLLSILPFRGYKKKKKNPM